MSGQTRDAAWRGTRQRRGQTRLWRGSARVFGQLAVSGGAVLAGTRRHTLDTMRDKLVQRLVGTSEPVELPGIVAEDPAARARRHVPEVVVDRVLRFRPRAVGVRVVGGPHDAVVAEHVEHAQPGVIRLEGRPHLTTAI